jgi:signal transduction histidine kinase
MGLRAIFENAPMAFAALNRQGVVVEMNPAFEQMVRDSGATRPLRLRDLVLPQDRDQAEFLLRELAEGRRDYFRIGAALAGAGSEMGSSETAESRRAAWTIWSALNFSADSVAWLLLADSAELRRSESSRRQAQTWEAVGRLAGGVAHDFNNLLTGVTLYCDLLLAGLEGDERMHSYAEEIHAAALQAAGMVRQLLLLARPQNSEPCALSLNNIAQGMRNLLTRLIGENITLSFHLEPELGRVNMDPAQAQQIFLNLVLNARDALPNGGSVTVESSNCQFQSLAATTLPQATETLFPCVLLAVSDKGAGMDAETRKRLFEPFFTTKDSGRGTGLGLTTVHSIVTRNGGLIHVESEPGTGTRVMLLLPRVQEPVPLHSQEAANPHPDSRDSENSGPENELQPPLQKTKKEKEEFML